MPSSASTAASILASHQLNPWAWLTFRKAVDFMLAFAVVHEFPDVGQFFAEVSGASKPGATLLIAEPKGHVKASKFEDELKAAQDAGFEVVERPTIGHSHAALLRKS